MLPSNPRSLYAVLCLSAAVTLLPSCACAGEGREDAAPVTEARPAEWAQALSLEGVPNLHKVSDTLYRSAQPTADGMKQLKALGIRTVVNLHSIWDNLPEWIEALDMDAIKKRAGLAITLSERVPSGS